MKEIVSSQKAMMAVFSSEESLKKALELLQSSKAEILEIRSPYDLDLPQINTNRFTQNAGRITFWCGIAGFILSFLGLIYLHTELPVQFAGKPLIPWPSFIIPAFLGAILCSTLGLCLSFFAYSHIIPGQQQVDYNCKSNDDSFCLIFTSSNQYKISELTEELTEISYLKQNIALPFPIKMEIK